ncbi:MAG: tetratricopeptide repeat protein [Chitinophagaceae bacterium]
MKKKTLITLLVSGFLSVSGLKAQSIQEGKNNLYADRYKSAIGVFEKLLATNPNNIEAIYWLGQTYLEMDEFAGARVANARALYEKGLQSTANAPLLLVGLGHVELRENKLNDARQHFETALSMTRGRKGDDPAILSAVGRANAEAKSGDYNYAIEKLVAAADKGDKTPDIFLQLGNAYRKAKPGEGGGDAYKSYKKALEMDPNFAIADIRLAKLFESQKNWELFTEYLNSATKRDPNFTPAYYELFYYHFFRAKFPEAEVQLKKYIESKLPEKDIQDEYLYAQLSWARKDFDGAIIKAEAVAAAMGTLTKPKVYRLLADAYYRKGDSLSKKGDSVTARANFVNARKNSDEFFAKKNPDDIILPDYETKALILSKLGGTPDEIYSTYMVGASLDTTVEAKVAFLKKGADEFKSRGDSISRIKEGDLRLALIKLKTAPSQRDYFDAGFAYYQGNAYTRADSLFEIIYVKYPDEPYGPQMRFTIARILDSTMEKGAAVPFGLKYLEILEKDTAKNKKAILSTAGYLAQYYANIAKDKAKAIEYLKKMLVLNPENADIKKNIEILEKSPAAKPGTTRNGTKPAPVAKPKRVTTVKKTTVAKK